MPVLVSVHPLQIINKCVAKQQLNSQIKSSDCVLEIEI